MSVRPGDVVAEDFAFGVLEGNGAEFQRNRVAGDR
jgi:hypothetical protein